MEDELEEIVLRNTKLPIHAVEREHRLGADVGLDSLGMIMTLAEVEERYETSFPSDMVENLPDLTFGSLLRIVQEGLERRSRIHG